LTAVIETNQLAKRYGRRWALTECTLTIPEGKVVGLVGPNGAGKTTLLHLAVGLLAPTSGHITVLSRPPAENPAQLAKVGFVAQDTPLYPRLTVAQHLKMGDWLNPRWDNQIAARRIDQLGLDPRQRAGSLSGGQRAQLALTLAVAKRPELLILDEPVASLDPLARHEFLNSLTDTVAGQALSVILSSHLLSDLEQVCDHLILLAASRVQISSDANHLMASHYRLSGPHPDPTKLPAGVELVAQTSTASQTSMLVQANQPPQDPSWTVQPADLDDIVLAYMSQARGTPPATSTRRGDRP
jgi:ABC-2 type transport system ATP-binding protein